MNEESKKIIEKKLKNVNELPTLPVVYQRIMKLMANPKTTARDMGRVVEEDQSLTTKVLKMINSAFYGLPGRVSTVSHAVVMLGFREVCNISFSASVISAFGQKGDSKVFDHEKFWQHSLAVAIIARIIAKRIGPPKIKDPEEAYVAGLIHDIGKVIEDQYMHDDFVKVVELVKVSEHTISESEEKVFGFTHQDVGQLLSERWRLPSVLVDAIRDHGHPKMNLAGSETPLAAVVHLADLLARSMDLGYGGDPYIPKFVDEVWGWTGFNRGHIEIIMDEARAAYDELSGMGLTK